MTQTTFTAFHHGRCIASGDLDAVRAAALAALGSDSIEPLVFSDQTGAPQPFTAPPAAPARGRPRLGVSAREVTLLPRHWDWLAAQPGGASATLRRLVEAAARAAARLDAETRARISALNRLEDADAPLDADRLAELRRADRGLCDAAPGLACGPAAADAAGGGDGACAVISALAGDAPGAEAAVRALYAGDRAAFADESATWPDDVRDYLARLAAPAFSADPARPA